MTLAQVQSNTTPAPFIGETFTFNGGPSLSISVDDDDPDFEDGYVETGDPQTLIFDTVIDGTTYLAGSVIELEVALIDASGQEVYVVRIDGTNVGLTYRVGEEPTTGDVFTVDSGLDGTGNTSGQDSLEPWTGVICYALGTLILTPDGPRKIETLSADDLVLTADRGPQRVLWIGRREISFIGQNTLDAARPVKVNAGALGPRNPQHDLTLSPQHKLLLSGPCVREMFGCDEVLAPACGLTGLPGVRTLHGCRSVTYVHILLAQHEVVFANGAASESLYPGINALEMMPSVHRREIMSLVPMLRSDPVSGYGPLVRKAITRREAKALVRASGSGAYALDLVGCVSDLPFSAA